MSILIIGGTTAAGKSQLAMQLAERYDAAIVSADAMTVYRGLDIGTAKPTLEEQRRVPHSCIDVRNINEDFSVSDFVETVEQVREAHPRVIVAGGTPFYLSALVKPLADLPEADPQVRAELEALPNPYATLTERDPQSAARLHPNDRMRIIRALEVQVISGETMTALHARGGRNPPLDAPCIWLDPVDLDDRIEQRLQAMLTQGYVEEVRRVLGEGWATEAKPLKSFAYRYLIQHVAEGLDLDEALRCTARDTRRFARKQRTWSRGLGWFPDDADAIETKVKSAFKA